MNIYEISMLYTLYIIQFTRTLIIFNLIICITVIYYYSEKKNPYNNLFQYFSMLFSGN